RTCSTTNKGIDRYEECHSQGCCRCSVHHVGRLPGLEASAGRYRQSQAASEPSQRGSRCRQELGRCSQCGCSVGFVDRQRRAECGQPGARRGAGFAVLLRCHQREDRPYVPSLHLEVRADSSLKRATCSEKTPRSRAAFFFVRAKSRDGASARRAGSDQAWEGRTLEQPGELKP